MKCVLIVVGCNEYAHKAFKCLRFAEADALRFSQFIGALGPPMVIEPPLILLGKSDIEILTTVRAAVTNLIAGDLFIFYFAGHGVLPFPHGQHLLLCKDAMPDIIETNNTNGTIPFATLDQITCGAHDRLLIFDACRKPFLRTRVDADIQNLQRCAGDARSKTSTRDVSTGERIAGAQGQSAVVWSCKDGELSIEDEDAGGGIFTFALIEHLAAAFRAGRPAVFDIAMMQRLHERMAQLTGVAVDQTPALSCSGDAIVLAATFPESTPCFQASQAQPVRTVSHVADTSRHSSLCCLSGEHPHAAGASRVAFLTQCALYALAIVVLGVAMLEQRGHSVLLFFSPTLGVTPP